MRIQAADPTRLPFWLRLFFHRQKRKYGQLLQPALVWARRPLLFLAVGGFWGAINRRSSPLPAALRQWVQVYVSRLTWCRFCLDLNASFLLDHPDNRARLEALDHWEESPLFSPAERAALAWTRAMSGTGCQTNDSLHQQLQEHFSEQQIMELTALIAFQNMSARFNAALDIPAQGLCQVDGRAVGFSQDSTRS